jgi:uncharacterized membrane protein
MEPIDNPENYKWGIFYFNKTDSRTIVPKRTRALGWTFNFARWGSYAFTAIIIAIVVWAMLQ